MAWKRKSGRRLPPFVALTWNMLNSKAYKKLPASPAKALPYFLGKVKVSYNDPLRYSVEFSFSYSEARKYGFANATFSKSIQFLVSIGFIDPIDKGGLRSDCKSFNKFRLSRRWENYGTMEFQSITWNCFVPKPRIKATLKNKTSSVKKGNKNTSYEASNSQFDGVGSVL